MKIRVYQGESREASENELLGQFEFSDFQRGARGEVEIDVTFEINTDGIVNVTASDKRTGQQRLDAHHALVGSLRARDREHHRPRRREPRADRGDRRAAPVAATAREPSAATAGAANAGRAAPLRPAAPAPSARAARRTRRPRIVDEDDALIPMPDMSDLLDAMAIDADDSGRIRSRSDPEATTQPELETLQARRRRSPTPPTAIARPRGRDRARSEEDLAALDTSDLDVAVDRRERLAVRHVGRRPHGRPIPRRETDAATMKMAPSEIVALARIIEELDYYQLLDLRRDAGAGEVKRAYHNSSRNFHPDANRHLDGELRVASHAIAKRITEAYAVLRDPRRRQAYDRSLDERRAGADAARRRLRRGRPPRRRRSAAARTPQGRQFFKLAEADIARGNWAAAARNLQTALTFEPDNALFKERLAQAKQALR